EFRGCCVFLPVCCKIRVSAKALKMHPTPVPHVCTAKLGEEGVDSKKHDTYSAVEYVRSGNREFIRCSTKVAQYE
ncbi:hypothetical protein M8C21_032378, partial [Ambrosia artemisiifolia]